MDLETLKFQSNFGWSALNDRWLERGAFWRCLEPEPLPSSSDGFSAFGCGDRGLQPERPEARYPVRCRLGLASANEATCRLFDWTPHQYLYEFALHQGLCWSLQGYIWKGKISHYDAWFKLLEIFINIKNRLSFCFSAYKVIKMPEEVVNAQKCVNTRVVKKGNFNNTLRIVNDAQIPENL